MGVHDFCQMSLEMGSRRISRPRVVIFPTSGPWGLLESCGLLKWDTLRKIQYVWKTYLVDWHATCVVLIVPFGEHNLRCQCILATTSRTWRCRRRRQIVPIYVNFPKCPAGNTILVSRVDMAGLRGRHEVNVQIIFKRCRCYRVAPALLWVAKQLILWSDVQKNSDCSAKVAFSLSWCVGVM